MSQTTHSRGVGFTSLLGLAFIILKLCGVIGWSWWWVLAPFWLSAALAILVLVIIALAEKDSRWKPPTKKDP